MPLNGSDRLDSWKDIAAFIDRYERTAMRWAKGQGMPVHRLPGKRGRVFASKIEIQRWMSGKSASDLASSSDPSTATHTPHRSWQIAALAIALGAIAVATAILFSSRSIFGSSVPVRATFTNNAIQALDSSGHKLWTHTFPYPIDQEPTSALITLPELVRFFDLPGKDHEMVAVVPLKTSPNIYNPNQFEVDCFSSRGKLLWTYVPRQNFNFGEHEIGGRWWVGTIFVSSVSPAPSIWVSFSDIRWGNSFVVQLDPQTGKGPIRFVNTGIIYKLNEISVHGRSYLLAGGWNNEYEGGSLAVIDESQPFAASPQTAGTRHKCVSCPPGAPDFFLIFPRSEINELEHMYEAPVREIQVVNGEVEVTRDDLKDIAGPNSIYLLDPSNNFHPLSLRYDSGYDMLHAELSNERKLSHSLEDCPERAHPKAVRLWTPSSYWLSLQLKPAKSTD
jgi:hypothetical protein